jgi:chemotaxis protein CheD
MIMLEIRVGEGIVARTPEIITSSGLGSCIVVTLYDLRQKIGGMAHIILPYSTNPPLPPFSKGG